MLAITSDYAKSTGCPEPHLRQIAEAGFSHVHWCHHWNAYTKCLSLEVSMRQSEISGEKAFLAKAFEVGTALAEMVN
jgi:hypothetical protein